MFPYEIENTLRADFRRKLIKWSETTEVPIETVLRKDSFRFVRNELNFTN